MAGNGPRAGDLELQAVVIAQTQRVEFPERVPIHRDESKGWCRVNSQQFWVYIARCCDGSLSVGHYVDVDSRITPHNDGKVARWQPRVVRLSLHTASHSHL